MLDSDSVNKHARQALINSNKSESGFSSQYCPQERLIRVYDGNGEYVYDFYLKCNMIKYHLVSSYTMDKDTKKLVKKVLRQHWIKTNFPAIMICTAVAGVFAFAIFSSIKDKKRQKDTQNISDTIPTLTYDSTKTALFQEENIRE